MGHPTLPDLDFDKSRPHPVENSIRNSEEADVNWEVVEYLMKVVEFWLSDLDIDGFRLDVPNEVPFWFWEMFRDKAKSIKEDCYLVGEIWHDAEEWVNDKYFDAVMNYAYFKDPVMNYFCFRKCSTTQFLKEISLGLIRYSAQSAQIMMNLIDSHDTFRYLESAEGDIRKLQLAIMFQMTYVGVPHIWYGDEIGMRGGHDPDNRRPFNWKYVDDPDSVAIRDFYANMIKIRRDSISLRRGEFIGLESNDDILSFWRIYKNERNLIIINNTTVQKTYDLKNMIIKEKLAVRVLFNENTNIVMLNPFSGCILEVL
ncbi:MAG: alpha-amylase family glycosyl hydrolase [Candidatus Cloacimonetes bacterium]|nr:alpha-amylase family glycosyl hydrolase [Candidatus Cloacimonadota bacterium]